MPLFKSLPTGTVVGDTDTQTLTNKSLTAPTLTGTTTAAAMNISGDVAVNTNKFNITASTGAIAGVSDALFTWSGTSQLKLTAQSASNYEVFAINRTGNNTAIMAGFEYNGSRIGDISIAAGTATTFNTSSDKTRKEDGRIYSGASRIIDDIEIWDFKWKNSDQRGVGVYAQDAFKIFPDAITPSEEEGGWTADYSKYVPVLISDAQETHKKIEDLQKQIDRLNEVILELQGTNKTSC